SFSTATNPNRTLDEAASDLPVADEDLPCPRLRWARRRLRAGGEQNEEAPPPSSFALALKPMCGLSRPVAVGDGCEVSFWAQPYRRGPRRQPSGWRRSPTSRDSRRRAASQCR